MKELLKTLLLLLALLTLQPSGCNRAQDAQPEQEETQKETLVAIQTESVEEWTEESSIETTEESIQEITEKETPAVTFAPSTESEHKDDSYVLAESNIRVYSVEEIRALTREELVIARNELYARHGRRFKRQDLQDYFNGKSWYRGTIDPDDFDEEAILSDVEKANRELIRGVEEGTLEANASNAGSFEVSSYLGDMNALIKAANMQKNDSSSWFSNSYQKDGLLMETTGETNTNADCVYLKNTNKAVTLFDIRIGDTLNAAHDKLSYYGTWQGGSVKSYNQEYWQHCYVCYQKYIYFLYLDFDAQNRITGWTMFNWMEGIPDEILADILLIEEEFRDRQASRSEWQNAYLEYLKEHTEINYTESYLEKDVLYELVDLNKDSIPELIFQDGAFGKVCSYVNGEVEEMTLSDSGFDFKSQKSYDVRKIVREILAY